MRVATASGMPGFTLVWLGQLASSCGSTMTGFAISLWAWQETGQATALALVGFFTFMPTVLLSPLAGALVDRWPRKLVLILADFGSSLSALAILALYLDGSLSIWHLYLLGAMAGAFNSLHTPAYTATISTMLPKAQFARANGMLALANSAATVTAPLLAGILLGTIGIVGILLIDILTFLLAFLTLLLVVIPSPRSTEAGRQGRGSLASECTYGFRYIFARPGLPALLGLHAAISFIGAFGMVMLTPMVLARSGSDELVLGSVLSALGVGGLAGGTAMSVWGGPRKRIHGVLGGLIAVSLCGYLLLGFARTLPLWMAGAFGITFFVPFLSACNRAIWQAKVAPDVQGKVFAARQLAAEISMPVVMLVAGPLADWLFEPAMQPGGALAGFLGGWLGSGEGAGMGLMFVGFGVAGFLIGVAGYLSPAVRNVEKTLPDEAM